MPAALFKHTFFAVSEIVTEFVAEFVSGIDKAFFAEEMLVFVIVMENLAVTAFKIEVTVKLATVMKTNALCKCRLCICCRRKQQDNRNARQ